MLFSILICQSVAELEQKWQSEVDDAMQGKLENNMPFFYDYHFNEVSKLYDSSLGIAVVILSRPKSLLRFFCNNKKNVILKMLHTSKCTQSLKKVK